MRSRRTVFLLTAIMAACSGADGPTDPSLDAGTDGGGDACGADDAYTAADCADAEQSARLMALDTDRDGLTDYEELCVHGTDPCDRDTDGDGYTDLAEVTAGTDPNDPNEGIPADDFYAVLPHGGGAQEQTLALVARVQRADVYLLLDTTGSMANALAHVQASIEAVTGWVGAHIPDAQMGVGHLEDFPFGDYGGEEDVPYRHVQDITSDVHTVHAAVDGLEAGSGADAPASFTEALYQSATGAGGSWTYSGGGEHTLPPRSCLAVAGEPSPRVGYPCFRPDALPIVVMTGDDEWHNDHLGGNGYSGINPPPATFNMAASALHGIGGRFIAVWGNVTGMVDAGEMARRTGSVDEGGDPLVFIRADSDMSDGIIDGLAALIESTPQDVTTDTEAIEADPDGADATAFIQSIDTVEGRRADTMGAAPGVTYADKDDSTFFGVIPGTELEFGVSFRNDVHGPAASDQIFQARIHILGHGSALLDTRQVYVIVPWDDGA